MKYLAILLIRFYRKFLSPLKGRACCRFVPSCSSYALEAFRKRGFFAGLVLTVRRVARCNPYHPGGYDPVPEKGFSYKGDRTIPEPDESRGNGGTARADAPRLAFHEGTKKKYTVVPAPKKGKETQ